MTKKPYRGISDAQANAEALSRRGSPYSAASEMSFSVQWDWHRREPEDLREAIRLVRKAYADEVPDRMHEGPTSIGIDGTPKMTSRAEGYIFGSATSDDAQRDPETGERDVVGYHYSPFRAHLADLSGGNEANAKRAAIVEHITVGSQGPVEAAIAEGVPLWCAKVVAEDAVRVFLRGLTDLRLHLRRVQEADSAVA